MLPKLFTLLALLAIFAVPQASAHQGATGVVKERMDIMKSYGEATKAIHKMLTGKVTYDEAAIRLHHQALTKHTLEAGLKPYPKNSLDKPTEALPAIWKDWDRFKKLMASTLEQAKALDPALDQGKEAYWDAFERLSKACKVCHDDFKQKKK